MRQHLFGMLMFGVIIGTTFFVSRMLPFASIPLPAVKEIYENKFPCEAIESKTIQKRLRKVEIQKAVYDVNTKKLKVVLLDENSDDLPKCTEIRLELINQSRTKDDFLKLSESNFNYNKSDGSLIISTVLDRNIKPNSILFLLIHPNDDSISNVISTNANSPRVKEVSIIR